MNIWKSWPCPPDAGSQSIDWLLFGLPLSRLQSPVSLLPVLHFGRRRTRLWPTKNEAARPIVGYTIVGVAAVCAPTHWSGAPSEPPEACAVPDVRTMLSTPA